MLRIQNNKQINEAIKLKRLSPDKYGSNRIVVVSDKEDPREASNETFKVRDILSKARFKANWDAENKYWWWNDKFHPIEEVLKVAQEAVDKANMFLKQDSPEKVLSFDQLDDIREFLEVVKTTANTVKAAAGTATKDLIDKYIEGLSLDLDNPKLLDDIASFNKAKAQFILESGQHMYTIYNVFLIWMQIANTGAKQFGSVNYWLGLGYKPKPDAKEILIVKREDGTLGQKVYNITQNFPNAAAEYAREVGFTLERGKFPIPKERMHAFWEWATRHNYRANLKTGRFIDVVIYDNLNVEPIPGREQITPPEPPKWWADDKTYDEKADIIMNALLAFAEAHDIKIDYKTEDELGGARGVSMGGHVQLLTDSVGVGFLSTMIHELTHELLHQKQNKGLGFYAGDDLSRDEKELQAESVAYLVLKHFDFPVQHSINYLALWKSDKGKIRMYAKVLRDTSDFIFKQIANYITPENKEEFDIDQTEQDMAALNEAITKIKNLMKKLL